MTPLHKAAETGASECCQELLLHGAAVNVKNNVIYIFIFIYIASCDMIERKSTYLEVPYVS